MSASTSDRTTGDNRPSKGTQASSLVLSAGAPGQAAMHATSRVGGVLAWGAVRLAHMSPPICVGTCWILIKTRATQNGPDRRVIRAVGLVDAGYSVTSCDLRVLMDQPTEPIPSHDAPGRHDDS
jgi:hypothetical protein